MKILIAPDKFKGSMSAYEVCKSIGNGLKKCKRSIETTFHPMADGGDGSLEVLSEHLVLEEQRIETVDPIGRSISTIYYTSSEIAFIELASASGLVLLKKEERNPLLSSTLGTGYMIRDAIHKGYKKIYLFLGGSATNDGGTGITSAMGCKFLDKEKNVLQPTGENLPHIHHIEQSSLFDFKKIKITLLCDVTNPLFGPTGAAYVYARQKGANDEQIKYLDDGLRHFSSIIQQQFETDIKDLPGCGAAGGIGASLVPLFGAELKSGFSTIAEITGLEEQIRASDVVISGEGRLDMQSLHGKVVGNISTLCKKYGKPLVLFVGKNDLSEQDIQFLKTEKIFSITENAENIADAMLNGSTYLEEMAYRFCGQLG